MLDFNDAKPQRFTTEYEATPYEKPNTEDIWHCDHIEQKLVQFHDCAGRLSYRYQCQCCGTNTKSVKTNSLTIDQKANAGRWDESIKDNWRESRLEIYRDEKRQYKQGQRREYEAYINSSTWDQKRQLVLKRANGVCEGCGQAEPTQVHHLTYDNFTNEFLFELVALCAPCHGRIPRRGGDYD